ncbi:acyl transferase [Chryseobacterium taklimakanense]|uniref:LuxE/PaaK family acyltransferase n=1 Tax=Chryseobacterium taklimakanense TaxID=536441 RepID=UPI0023F6FE18|nr:acyl transferase [Chryseobacterium taklimakanense]
MFNNIFNIKSEVDFQEAALETFRYQYENVEVYRKFVNFLKISPDEVKDVEKIPFLPIEMFKNQLVIDGNFKTERYFQSSGTTQMLNRSKHFITNFGLYEESIYRSFEQFIGKPDDYIFLGLLPNYSENPNSSLIYMVDYLMKKSGKPENGYFLYNHAELLELLKTLKGKKVILFGVSFALLDFLDFCQAEFSKTSHSPLHVFTDSIKIIETGGMKGRKEEMTKDELLTILKNGYGTEQIFSEYSMTELLSQAYSLGENIYETPNWMRILIRNTEDPFSYVKDGRNGAINIIDLANRHSCSFIATQDLGSVRKLETKKSIHPAFSVAGRIDHSDIRGCSLLIS